MTKRAKSTGWAALVAIHSRKTLQYALQDLRSTSDYEPLRAALVDVPARDRPMLEMSLALRDDARRVARTTRNPKLCLDALLYLSPDDELAAERFAALAILIERLHLTPGTSEVHLHVARVCNVFSAAGPTDRSLANVPAGARARLAKFANALLDGATPTSRRLRSACGALDNVGDETSIALLEATCARVKEGSPQRDWLDEALARTRRRVRKK